MSQTLRLFASSQFMVLCPFNNLIGRILAFDTPAVYKCVETLLYLHINLQFSFILNVVTAVYFKVLLGLGTKHAWLGLG